MVGKNPVLEKLEDNKLYLNACFDFFEDQLQALDPNLLVVLGVAPLKALLIRYGCGRFNTFKDYFLNPKTYIIKFNNNEYKMIAIPHPCNWHFNLKADGKVEIVNLIKKHTNV